MKFLKIGLIVCAAVIITALGIDASDTLQGNDGTLLSQVIRTSKSNVCPKGMIVMSNAERSICIDTYEAGVSDKCPIPEPANIVETKVNLDAKECVAITADGVLPWRNITRDQAEVACARSGKRLATNEEWYQAALGTRDDGVCNVSGVEVMETGRHDECVSGVGAYDMIGNVWEWVSGDVEAMYFEDVRLPDSGYVAQVDSRGLPRVTTETDPVLFNSDYHWTVDDTQLYAVLRGGFYGSGHDGGVYAFHAATPPTTPGTAIGFRCVVSI